MSVAEDRIRGFDGLRGIAILLVLLTHKCGAPTAYGQIGVWLFFVLSGFLIVRILARTREEIEAGEAGAGAAMGAFFWRRATRLLPVYYGVLGLFAAASLFVPLPQYQSYAPYYWLHAANFPALSEDRYDGFAHLWSLAIEEQFYLLTAPLLLLAPRKYAFAACGAIVAIGVSTKISMHAAGASMLRIYVNSLCNFALLGFGGALGLMADRPPPRAAAGGGAQTAMLCICLASFAAASALGLDWLVFGPLAAIPAGILVLQVFQGQHTAFVALLDSKALRHLGRISYGLYLYHSFISFAPADGPAMPWAMAEVCAALLVATLSWRYIEQPIIAWAKRARFAGVRAKVAATA